MSTVRGGFVAFEGIDGSGKSTQLQNISNRLKAQDLKIYTTFEPTDGPVGALIRKMLAGAIPIDQKSIALLFAADRTEHLTNQKNGIKKKVDQGEIVLCDRYYFSSYAYHAQYIDMEWIIHTNSLNAEILKPDLTIFIDVDPDVCIERIKQRRSQLEMYDKIDIMKKVRANYFKAFEKLRNREKIVVVDGNRSLQQVEDAIFTEINKFGIK